MSDVSRLGVEVDARPYPAKRQPSPGRHRAPAAAAVVPAPAGVGESTRPIGRVPLAAGPLPYRARGVALVVEIQQPPRMSAAQHLARFLRRGLLALPDRRRP